MAKLFNSIAEINAATGFSLWELGHNFTDYDDGVDPAECEAVSDGTAFPLRCLGANTPTKLAPPQARYGDQGAMRVNVADGFVYRGAHADWSVDATVPTAYLVHFRVDATDSTEQTIFSGLSGAGSEGWRLTVKGSGTGAGLKLYVMGVGSSVPAGSAEVCDGNAHTVLIVIDDANNRARMVSKWGTVTMTGVFTYSQSGHLICTVGPTWTGATWTKATSYFCSFKGKHADAYNNAADIWALLNQDIIAKSLGSGGVDGEGSDGEGAVSLGAGAIEGAMNSFESDWDETVFSFTGTGELGLPEATGTFESPEPPMTFTANVLLDAPTAKGVIVRSLFARERHVDKALSRIVRQLRGSYNPASVDFVAQTVELDAPSASGTFEES